MTVMGVTRHCYNWIGIVQILIIIIENADIAAVGAFGLPYRAPTIEPT